MTFLSPANAQLVNPNWQSGPGGTIPTNEVYSYDPSARSNYFAGYTPASLQMSGTVYDEKLADGATTQMGISDGSSGSGMGFSISGSVDPKGIGPISFSMASHVDDQPFAFGGKGRV